MRIEDIVQELADLIEKADTLHGGPEVAVLMASMAFTYSAIRAGHRKLGEDAETLYENAGDRLSALVRH